jgi:hypothetical protein
MPRSTPKPKRPSRPVRPQLPPQAKKLITRPAPQRVQPSARSGFRG